MASTPARSIMRAKPPVENGEFLSDVNTNGDFGSCSRGNLRRARILVADNGVGGRCALLGPAYVEDGVGKIDLIPTQVV